MTPFGGRTWSAMLEASVLILVVASCGDSVVGPEDGPTATRIRAGFDFSCALDVDATVICWGRNTRGQLGIGSDSGRISPVRVEADGKFIDVSTKANGLHACAVSIRRRVYCWGENNFGQLGTGDRVNKSVPTRVDSDLDFRTVTAGWRFTCGLTVDDEAFCWGRGEWGQLGDGLATLSTRPVAVAGGHRFRFLEVGSNNLVCGLTLEGRVLCWGLQFFGSLGAPAPDTCSRSDGLVLECAKTPQPISLERTFIHVTTGSSFACAIDDQHNGWCWGVNTIGQLGSAQAVPCLSFDEQSLLPCSPEPVMVAGNLAFASMSAGVQHACGVTSTGTGYCWGGNPIGQHGDGNLGTFSLEPVEVVGGLEFLTISAGANHSCGETLGRNLWCWGLNDRGQLGTASNNLELVPALVAVDR